MDRRRALPALIVLACIKEFESIISPVFQWDKGSLFLLQIRSSCYLEAYVYPGKD